jgi:hypothetical protein
MSREVPALGVDEGLVRATLQRNSQRNTVSVSEPLPQSQPSETGDALASEAAGHADVFEQAVRLHARTKVALIRKLLTQLDTNQIQAVLEYGLREIGDRHRRGVSSTSANHHTRLLLKKDYSYQERGLDQPTQYYVYLRRRKPKLDRYIGALFYIPEGCTLSYFLDAEGRIIFNSPHNVFQLRDCSNPAIVQVVRLICLEPPPPDYTFTKQQEDVPEIRLHLEYLDPLTHQSIARQAYFFPACMHEGGRLDRYRWEVSTVTPALEPSEPLQHPVKPPVQPLVSNPQPFENESAVPDGMSDTDYSPLISPIKPEQPLNRSEQTASSPIRQVLELPAKPLTFCLCRREDADTILKRMRLWVSWSEKAMPQSRWEITQSGEVYTLINAHFKRQILKFSRDRASITLENSLPVLVKWFHDLSLAVSQAQNQRQYSASQLKLAHSLFVDMSLPQKDPLVVLKKLFGVEFSKN